MISRIFITACFFVWTQASFGQAPPPAAPPPAAPAPAGPPPMGPGAAPNPMVPGSPGSQGGPGSPNGPGGAMQQQLMRQSTQMLQQPQTPGMNQMPGGMNQTPGMNQMPGTSSGQSNVNNAPQNPSPGQGNLGGQPANFINNTPLQNMNFATPGSQIINLSPATGGSFISPSPFGR